MTGHVATPRLGCLQETWLPAPPPESIRRRLLSMPRAVLLVCGGRDYRDRAHVFSVLDGLRPCAVVHGACGVDADRPQWTHMRGADRLVDDWCILRPVPASRVPARWSALGQRAGGVRNQQMLDLYHPVLVVAFPGHLGTADMVSRARAAGVPIWKPPAPDLSAAPRAAIASARRR